MDERKKWFAIGLAAGVGFLLGRSHVPPHKNGFVICLAVAIGIGFLLGRSQGPQEDRPDDQSARKRAREVESESGESNSDLAKIDSVAHHQGTRSDDSLEGVEDLPDDNDSAI